MSLSNKVALISGANRGIGAATVRELLKAGVSKIYAGARDTQSLPDFQDDRIVPVQFDVTSDQSVASAAALATDVDVLINNGGTMGFGDWLSGSQEDIERDMNTNLYGTLRVIRAFAPQMTERGSGTVANLVSIVGLGPVPAIAGYSASKAAVHSLTQALRGTLEPQGVKVLGIYPGPVDTDLAKNIPLEKVSPEHVAERIVQGIAAGESYIYPDPMAEQISQLWATNAPQVEVALRLGS